MRNKYSPLEVAHLRKLLRDGNKQYRTETFIKLPVDRVKSVSLKPIKAYRNNKFLVQIYDENGKIRMSVNRTALEAGGDWVGNITWDELQDIKSKVGYGDCEAVEVYPKDSDLMNVANIRHLWLIPTSQPLPWTWRAKQSV